MFVFLLLQKALTGLDDLRQVKALEMRVNTRENSLGNFGERKFYSVSDYSTLSFNEPKTYISILKALELPKWSNLF